MQKNLSEQSNSKEKLILQLYVSGMSSKSMQAIRNIKQICVELSKAEYTLEIVDIYKNPELAAKHHIVFSPSLIKQKPLPRRMLIGTLADRDMVLKALGITPKE
ncbi:circadian clock KaiB family protein [Sediminicola sp. 1XM1-17]|uniref:circadian clock KaiB family protein n=1 Tax=Sediminicola sp. 1XM1-17 TaxID=3127702 RepID=UPI0030788B33